MKLLERTSAARSKAKAAITATLLLGATSLHAAGLRTQFGVVTVRGLKIGKEYSLNNLVNLPLRIVNTGTEATDVRIDVTTVTTTGNSNYEPLPDNSWIKLEANDFAVQPNHEAVTDIRINIPNDQKLLGRRFEAHIWSRTKPTRHSMYGAGLLSVLRFEVSSVAPTEDELKKKLVDRRLANLDFTLYPTQGTAEDVPVGTTVDLRKERKVSLKLVNPNDAKLTFKFRSIPFWETLLEMPAGFEAGPFTWIKPAQDTVVMEGNSIKDTSIILNIPDEDQYKGKSFAFAISVEAEEQEISARVFYELFVKTRAKQGAVK